MPNPEASDPQTQPTPGGAPLTSKAPGFRTPKTPTTRSRSTTPPAPADQPATEEATASPSNLRDRVQRLRAKARAHPVDHGDAHLPPGGPTYSRASSDTVRNVTKLVYVLVRGGTKLSDRLVGQRFGRSIAATAEEARDIARPLARMVSRRVDWTGDASDTMDGLFLLFALGGFVADRMAIDLDNIERDPGWDAELYGQIEDEVRATRRRRRRPRGAPGDTAQPGPADDGGPANGGGSEPAPGGPPPPRAPASSGLLADHLIAATTPPKENDQ
jgi:hypothetical protein